MIPILLMAILVQNMTSLSQAILINDYVESTVEYTYFKYPRGIETTLKTGIGDCTDKAMLICAYLEAINFTCTLQHGYIHGSKHDYYTVLIDNVSYTSSIHTLYIGDGIW